MGWYLDARQNGFEQVVTFSDCQSIFIAIVKWPQVTEHSRSLLKYVSVFKAINLSPKDWGGFCYHWIYTLGVTQIVGQLQFSILGSSWDTERCDYTIYVMKTSSNYVMITSFIFSNVFLHSHYLNLLFSPLTFIPTYFFFFNLIFLHLLFSPLSSLHCFSPFTVFSTILLHLFCFHFLFSPPFFST